MQCRKTIGICVWQIVKCYCAHSLNTYRDSGLKTQIESFSVVCLLPLTTKTPWNRENRFIFFCSTKNVIENTMFQWNKRSMFFFVAFLKQSETVNLGHSWIMIFLWISQPIFINIPQSMVWKFPYHKKNHMKRYQLNWFPSIYKCYDSLNQ